LIIVAFCAGLVDGFEIVVGACLEQNAIADQFVVAIIASVIPVFNHL
jgi:hypothetical protein